MQTSVGEAKAALGAESGEEGSTSDAASDAESDGNDPEAAAAEAVALRARGGAGTSNETVMDALQMAEQTADAAGTGTSPDLPATPLHDVPLTLY